MRIERLFFDGYDAGSSGLDSVKLGMIKEGRTEEEEAQRRCDGLVHENVCLRRSTMIHES